MNLISCNECGVVLDKGKLQFPMDIHLNDGGIDQHLAGWAEVADEWVAKVACPVCKGDILE